MSQHATRPLPTTFDTPTAGEVLAAHLDVRLAAEPELQSRIGIIRDAFGGRIAFSSSLGVEDQAVLHAIADARADIDVFTLDTGRHFAETLETLDATERRYGRRIRLIAPAAEATEALVARDGVLGFRLSLENRKTCCDVRKVQPLRRALEGAAGWITGLRREQSAGRATVPFAAYDATLGLMKLNPIADWSQAAVEDYAARNEIPVNPLHAKGFPSIGCAPCTRAIEPGEDVRAGRWWWEQEDGKECGLHNRPKTVVSTNGATR
ncbi:MAG: phosphoadenylyl-sulfate reductase [Hyphomicrobium sp.]|nr:phosphoadenylyl-sulfate reductase [Hyphomicrobium sp.]PPC82301.1 MAG: phosphoadenylyl-sulfate reductase [Hyphomicrobium sp.]